MNLLKPDCLSEFSAPVTASVCVSKCPWSTALLQRLQTSMEAVGNVLSKEMLGRVVDMIVRKGGHCVIAVVII
jgi:hypothetical protein